MLGLDAIDLSSLCSALEDNSADVTWWIDPRTGEVGAHVEGNDDEALDDLDERGLVVIEPIGSREAYGDLEAFTARVRDPRARELLERAIAGRGAFRRFKDTLFEFEDLRRAWFAFHDVRMERRAIGWLRDEGVIDDDEAERALAARPDPDLPPIAGPFDAEAIARAVAADLETLYGDRLKGVVLFGSWARGDAHPESDIDLLIVLDDVGSPYDELRHMAPILDRYSESNETVVSAHVVEDRDWKEPTRPFLIRAKAEGKHVA